MGLNINKVLINGIRASSLLFLTAGNALATVTNSSSTDIVSNLGFFSNIAGTIVIYSKYIAFFMAIVSLLALWVSGMFVKVSKKVDDIINAHEGLKKWLFETFLVISAFISYSFGSSHNQ